MKERPILFSTPMVQAILAGKKTQTRRTKGLDNVNELPDAVAKPAYDPSTNEWVFTVEYGHPRQFRAKCPYGEVGDVLWVRESFANVNSKFDKMEPLFIYKADGISENFTGKVKWKPSIHMPYAACRLKLEITGIRVEWLHDIKLNDLEAEGFVPDEGYSTDEAVEFFDKLWSSINGPESWTANPFVWVIEFKRADK